MHTGQKVDRMSDVSCTVGGSINVVKFDLMSEGSGEHVVFFDILCIQEQSSCSRVYHSCIGCTPESSA